MKMNKRASVKSSALVCDVVSAESVRVRMPAPLPDPFESMEVPMWDERIFFAVLIHADSEALVIIPAPLPHPAPLISLNAVPF